MVTFIFTFARAEQFTKLCSIGFVVWGSGLKEGTHALWSGKSSLSFVCVSPLPHFCVLTTSFLHGLYMLLAFFYNNSYVLVINFSRI